MMHNSIAQNHFQVLTNLQEKKSEKYILLLFAIKLIFYTNMNFNLMQTFTKQAKLFAKKKYVTDKNENIAGFLFENWIFLLMCLIRDSREKGF